MGRGHPRHCVVGAPLHSHFAQGFQNLSPFMQRPGIILCGLIRNLF